MSLQLRRGLESARTGFTPVSGEPIYTTDEKKLYIGDDTTAGGVLAKCAPVGSAGGMLSGTYPNPNVSLTTASNSLSSDVTTTSADTWYDGASVSLAAGTWVVDSVIHLEKGATAGTSSYAVRIGDGTNHYASGSQAWPQPSGAYVVTSLSCIITLASTTTIKVQAESQYAGGKIRAASGYGSSGNNSTQITAVRIA